MERGRCSFFRMSAELWKMRSILSLCSSIHKRSPILEKFGPRWMDSVSSSRDRAIQEGFIEIWQHSIDTKKMRKKGRRLVWFLLYFFQTLYPRPPPTLVCLSDTANAKEANPVVSRRNVVARFSHSGSTLKIADSPVQKATIRISMFLRDPSVMMASM
jgi:hypothetical protein